MCKIRELNKSEYDRICEECLLNENERQILKMKIFNYSIIEMSLKLNMSTSQISRIIKRIKIKIIKLYGKD